MNKRVLIVDDSQAMRMAIRSILANQPDIRICGEAVDGVDGIAKAEELKPDLILLDLVMPRMNGVEAAAVLKERLPRTPVILFTMHDTLMRESLAGVSVVMSKPDGFRKLAQCIHTLLDPASPPA